MNDFEDFYLHWINEKNDFEDLLKDLTTSQKVRLLKKYKEYLKALT